MEENLLYIYKGKVKLLPSELSTQNAAVLGASSLIWSLERIMIRYLIPADMANFNEVLNHILGIIFIIIIFSVAYAYLKPHQLHKRRLLSTLVLKLSYLFYVTCAVYNCLPFGPC